MKKLTLFLSLSIFSLVQAMEPDSLVLPQAMKYGLFQEALIQTETVELQRMLENLSALNDYVNQLSRLVPVDVNSSPIWAPLLPHLAAIRIASAHVNNICSRGLSNINCLSTVITQCHELLKGSKGSKEDVEIAIKSIAEELAKLQNTLDEARKVQNPAQGIVDNSVTILKIIKKDSPELRMALADIQKHQQTWPQSSHKLQELFVAFDAKKRELSHFHMMLYTADKKLRGEAEALKERKKRGKELKELTRLSPNLSAKLSDILPGKCSNYVIKAQLQNYCDALVILLQNVYKEKHGKDCDKNVMNKAIFDEINGNFTTCKDEQSACKKELEDTCKTLTDAMENATGKVLIIKRSCKDDREALQALNCLEAATALSSQHSLLEPLICLLESVVFMTEPWVEVLKKDGKADVLLATKSLVRNSQFLNKLWSALHKIVSSSKKDLSKQEECHLIHKTAKHNQ